MITLAVGYVLYRAAILVYIIFLFTPTQPSTYLDDLSTDPATYAEVATIKADELTQYAYLYDLNQYANALPDVASKPKVADSDGKVPAFKLDDDIFVITYKWVNFSSGLAISDDPGFKTKIEKIDAAFNVKHLRDNIYQWEFDPEQ